MFVIPSCYHVVPPPVDTKLPNFSEETLFYIFYSAPQDVVQLMAAEELYGRGWRFNTDLRVWMTSPPLAQIDLHTDASSRPGILRGPFTVFNPSTWGRQETAGDFTVDVNSLEATRPASAIVAEKQARKEAGRSPNGGGGGNNTGHLTNVTTNPAYQNMQAAH
jgi:CCR4-NOT transcription complex subunit 2